VAVTGVNSLARYNLGVSLAQAGRLGDAEREFRRTLADDPGHLPAYDDLAAIAFTGGRQREALEILAAGLARAPRSPRLHYRMGAFLSAQGRQDEAAVHLEEAARGLPRFPAAHNDLGIIRANQGRLDEAELHFRDALAADPLFEDARYNLRLLDQLRERSRAPSP
jgi:tetratricopeptide (TPR) repeat protein